MTYQWPIVSGASWRHEPAHARATYAKIGVRIITAVGR